MLGPKGLKLLVLSRAPAEVKLSLSAFGKRRIWDEIHPVLLQRLLNRAVLLSRICPGELYV